jgi:hypothetical protein
MKAKRPRKPLPNGARAIMASVQSCPTCGRAYVTDGLELSPIRRRILNLIERHGEISSEVLHAAIWGSDPNGGPNMKTLHVIIHGLNKQLASHGLAVRAGPGGRNARGYRLIAEAAE